MMKSWPDGFRVIEAQTFRACNVDAGGRAPETATATRLQERSVREPQAVDWQANIPHPCSFFIAALIGVGVTFAWQSYGDEAKKDGQHLGPIAGLVVIRLDDEVGLCNRCWLLCGIWRGHLTRGGIPFARLQRRFAGRVHFFASAANTSVK